MKEIERILRENISHREQQQFPDLIPHMVEELAELILTARINKSTKYQYNDMEPKL